VKFYNIDPDDSLYKVRLSFRTILPTILPIRRLTIFKKDINCGTCERAEKHRIGLKQLSDNHTLESQQNNISVTLGVFQIKIYYRWAPAHHKEEILINWLKDHQEALQEVCQPPSAKKNTIKLYCYRFMIWRRSRTPRRQPPQHSLQSATQSSHKTTLHTLLDSEKGSEAAGLSTIIRFP